MKVTLRRFFHPAIISISSPHPATLKPSEPLSGPGDRSASSDRTFYTSYHTHNAFRLAVCRSASKNSPFFSLHVLRSVVGGVGTPGGRASGGTTRSFFRPAGGLALGF